MKKIIATSILVILFFLYPKSVHAQGAGGGYGYDAGTIAVIEAAANNAWQESNLDTYGNYVGPNGPGVVDGHAFDNFMYTMTNPGVSLGMGNAPSYGFNPIVENGHIVGYASTYEGPNGQQTTAFNTASGFHATVGCVNGAHFYTLNGGGTAPPVPPGFEPPSGYDVPPPGAEPTIPPGIPTSSPTPGVGTPTVTPKATATPPPGATATPTPPAITDDMCKCDNIEYTEIFPGAKATFTAYGKVSGSDMSYAKITGFNFFFYQGANNDVTIAQQANVPATVSDTSLVRIRYKAVWELDIPASLDKSLTYRIQAKPVCAKKSAAVPVSKKYVLGTEDNLKLGTFTPAQIIENNCSFIKFKFN